MRQRLLPKAGFSVSELGLGCEHLQGKDEGLIREVVGAALDGGINILDLFMSEPNVRTNIGRALGNRRDRVAVQGHIGSAWLDGQYTRTRDLEQCRRFFDDLLRRLNTEYMDIGMIHFVDDLQDWRAIEKGPVMEYAQSLKASGRIRATGMSSHNAQVALEAVRSGLIDVLMFSINPAYDLLHETTLIDDLFKGETYQAQTLRGVNPVRAELYRSCEALGVGITVMKTLGAGALLEAKSSPFGTALTVPQLARYALDRPGVASVLVGCTSPEQVENYLRYETLDEASLDYSSALGSTAAYSLAGRCMYCNHCLPCPARIDIAQVNKYLDLAEQQAQPVASVLDHYRLLEAHAGDCLACGLCEERCPFLVPVRQRMQQAKALFGL